MREQDYVADRSRVREQHDEPIDTKSHASGRRKAVHQSPHIILVHIMGFRVAASALLELPTPLLDFCGARVGEGGAFSEVFVVFALGAVVMAAIFVAAGEFGALCGLHGQSLELCTLYLRIMALGSPATAVLLVSCAALRAAGDTRSACGVMIIVNLANVILSVLFVFGPAPIGGHGVAGIAWGTALAWVIGTLLMGLLNRLRK